MLAFMLEGEKKKGKMRERESLLLKRNPCLWRGKGKVAIDTGHP